MNKLINLIGTIVLFGILIKLSYVFVYLFGELDDGSLISKITGITFAFASIYFVVKVKHNWLKITLVALDIATILYFYLHEKFSIDIVYSSFIVSTYSGLIVYYLGNIVREGLSIDSESTINRLHELENRQRIDNEIRELEVEINKYRRRIRQSRSAERKTEHQKTLSTLEERHRKLNSL